MSAPFTDLRSLYRAADHEAIATRADKRAVRKAILGAGIAGSALHAATASGKLISLIPGGAKVFTVGQLVVYTGLGAAVGGALAAVGAATAHHEVMANTASTTAAQRQVTRVKRAAPQPPAVANIEESVPRPEQAPPAPSTVLKPVSLMSAARPPLPRALATQEPVLQTPPDPATLPCAASSTAHRVPSLADESRELGTVQAALAAKDAHGALQLLDTQDRQFHGGNLTQERSAARVVALCIAGRISEADIAKSRFVTAYPGSPWLRRIAAACATDGIPRPRVTP